MIRQTQRLRVYGGRSQMARCHNDIMRATVQIQEYIQIPKWDIWEIHTIVTSPQGVRTNLIGGIYYDMVPPRDHSLYKCAWSPICPEWTWSRGHKKKILKVSEYAPSKTKNNRAYATYYRSKITKGGLFPCMNNSEWVLWQVLQINTHIQQDDFHQWVLSVYCRYIFDLG